MIKYFTFVIILIFNMNILSQIVIKDEVILDEINTSVYTPEYGQVRIWLKIHPTDPFTKAVIRIGEFTHLHGENYTCPCIGCSSVGEYILAIRDNVPAQTEISIEVSRCVDGEWTDCPVTYGGWNYNPPVYYEMEYNIAYGWGDELLESSDDPDEVEDMIRVYPTTPPGCDPQFECTEENFLPSFKLVQQDEGYEGYECSDNRSWKGFFVVPPKDEGYQYSINNVCFSKQLQRWWFNLNDDHSFIFNYILELCEENINHAGQILIDDYTDFPPEHGCDNILYDVEDHFKYPIMNATYLMEDIARGHEEAHKKYFEETIIEDVKFLLFEDLLSEPKECEDFNSIEEATDYWQTKLQNYFLKWRQKVIAWWGARTGGFDKTGGDRIWHEYDIHNTFMEDYWWLEWYVKMEYNCF